MLQGQCGGLVSGAVTVGAGDVGAGAGVVRLRNSGMSRFKMVIIGFSFFDRPVSLAFTFECAGMEKRGPGERKKMRGAVVGSSAIRKTTGPIRNSNNGGQYTNYWNGGCHARHHWVLEPPPQRRWASIGTVPVVSHMRITPSIPCAEAWIGAWSEWACSTHCNYTRPQAQEQV